MRPLVDLYGRHIRYVRISVTDRCNLRCRYCMPESGVQWVPHGQVMSYEEYLRILRICSKRGVEKVRITGGEPLVRKGIAAFVEQVGSIEGIRDISLTTNGILLDRLAADLKRSGLKRVNVSLDTLDRKKFAYITRVDAIDEVTRGIFSALEQGLSPLKINVVAIRGFNDNEIPEFARLTVDMPVQVRFIELMPIGCITKYPDHEAIDSEEIRGIIEDIYGQLETKERGLGPARVYKIPGAKGSIGLIGSLSEHDFCMTCNRIRITATGHLRPCLFSEDEIDLLKPMRSGIADEVLEDMIEEGVMRKPPSHGVCRGTELIHEGPRTKMFNIGG